MRTYGWVGIALMLTAGCRKADPSPPSPYELDAAPRLSHRSDLDLGGALGVLGWTMTPEAPWLPGASRTVTIYWTVRAPLPPGATLETALVTDDGRPVAALDRAGPLRALPLASWREGKVYVDELTVPLPADASGGFSLVVGLVANGVRVPAAGLGAEPDGRARVLHFRVAGTREPARAVPSIRAIHAGDRPPILDGVLDDGVWQRGGATGPFVDVRTGAPGTSAAVSGAARLAWDDTYFYVGVEVGERDIEGGFLADAIDPHLWEKSCAEIILDPDGDGDERDYYEIQLSPERRVFDSFFDAYNEPNGGPGGPFGHQEWSSGAEVATKVSGTVNDPSDVDRGYVVEARIPWARFDRAGRAGVPPRVGDTWRVNLYAMHEGGGVAWSPILGEGNFHRARRFGRVTFARIE